jgi:hypothetical protein
MKSFIAALLAIVMIAVTITPASADNSEEVIIGILGGALGGLIIGEAIGGHRHRDRVVERHYIYEDYYEPECYQKVFRVWDPYKDRYVKVRRVVCE